MRILAGIGRRHLAAGTLVAALAVGAAPPEAWSQSRSSVTLDGRTITVIGGTSQSVRSVDRRTMISVDGRDIVIADGTIELDGKAYRIGDFGTVEVRVRGDEIDVTVDGRPIR